MRKLLPATLILFHIFLSMMCMGQQPVLEVKSFEYTWLGGNGNTHIILALNDTVKLRMKNSFAKAVKARWNVELPQVIFSARPLPLLVYKPKFKPQLTERQPGKWYLFLQVYETGPVYDPRTDGDPAFTELDLRCKIISGDNDSVITDKTLTVNILKMVLPPDQVPLKRLPAYPDSFVQGFDSIATWLFEPEQISQKTIHVRPASIFQQTFYPDKPVNQLTFERDIFGINQLVSPAFTLSPSAPTYEKTGIKRNVGGRSIGGAITFLTGLSSSKTKYFKYRADYAFKDKDSTWHCLIGYEEEVVANRERVRNENGSFSMQSSDYTFSARYLDAHAQNVITINGDTLATFRIANKKDPFALASYDHMWDGKDSTSVVPLPPDWNNKIAEADMVISGTTGKDTFSMKTWKGKRIKEFYINDQLVTTVMGKPEPISGVVFHPVSMRHIKIFTILSWLPYSYYGGIN